MGDTRVSVSERAATAAFCTAVIGKIVDQIGRKYKIWRGLNRESDALIRYLNTLALGMDDELVKCGGTPRTAVARAYGQEMRALTHDIEDCLERFLHRLTCKEGSSRIHRTAHAIKSVPRCFRFAAEIKSLKRHLLDAGNRVFNPPGGSHTTPTATAPQSAVDAFVDYPVGIQNDIEDLLFLLQQPKRVMLISIVGFGGSGKTTLARAVYNRVTKVSSPPSCAWVSVNLLENSNHIGVLIDIHKQFLPGEPFSLSALKDCLKKQENGYLIVIDGIKEKHMVHWDTIRSVFKGCGGVILTTTLHSVANGCVTPPQEKSLTQSEIQVGHVYTIKKLSKEDSQKVALPWRCSPELLQGSGSLLEKCDGHPMALACVSSHLNSQNEPTGEFCIDLCKNLGSYLAWDGTDEPNFSRLRGVLFDSFTALPDHFVRTCMLYLGIFPVDHLLKRKVIIRRWCAEGYTRSDRELSELKVADRYFKLLVDRNIIQPVAPSSNSLVKSCRIHGIIHAFVVHKSVSEKFITMFDAESHGPVRHLVVRNSNATNPDSATALSMDLSRVRSLTVFGYGGAAITDFLKYKLIRVIDLEDCYDLGNHHLKDICKLWNLRYLSLGPNISAIPKEIAELKLLETLDVSKTTVNVLPWVVIGLQGLVHLIGRFALHVPVSEDTEKLKKLLVRSKLETLSGFIADGSPGLLQVMPHMKALNKVKIWISYTGGGVDLNNELAEVIPGFLKEPILEGNVRSLSLDFQAVPEGSLYAIQEIYNFCLHSGKSIHLSSLKLRGSFSELPAFVPLLKGLSELCLSLARVTQGLISELGKMDCLLYLKVTADQVEQFVIHKGAFQSLRRLRFVVRQSDFILPEVQEGALPHLVSLQLLCTSIIGISDFEINHLKSLKEVSLSSGTTPQTIRMWEEESKKHPNTPNILFI